MTSPRSKSAVPTVQDVCIDLPGDAVQCWRSAEKIRVVLRKHRDVIFDINLRSDALYTVESKTKFYNPVLKKLSNKADFFDGDRCHIWVGREFKDKLILKMNGSILGAYEVHRLDAASYGANPKTKPEPLLIVIGQRESSVPFICTPEDRFAIGALQSSLASPMEPKLSILKDLGTKFDYSYLRHSVEVEEYVAVTEAAPDEIQPQALQKLQNNNSVEGNVDQIFLPPKTGSSSVLYTALFTTAGYMSNNTFLTGNFFKESAGYLIEHFHKLNEIGMKVRIDGKVKGKYRVALKGYLVSDVWGKMTGAVTKLEVAHRNYPTGSKGAAFLDGGFGKTGKAGYGGYKRIIATSAANFKSGLKIQGIGTIIDLIVDVNAVYFDEKGSKDFSEFLGRAGVSIAKAGVTAALGSAFAALGTAGLALVFSAGAPVILVAAVVVAGFIGAAMLVDMVDDGLNIKGSVANWAR